MEYNYYIIDAFTKQRFQGAQIVVFPNAQGLTDQQMQMIAREMNLTESVFLFPGKKLRIFSPLEELGFGGHPIIAASYVLVMEGEIKQGISELQLNSGTIQVDVSENDQGIEKIQFSNQSPQRMDDFVPSAKELADILGLDESDIDLGLHKAMLVSCNEDYLIVPVKSGDSLEKARFNLDKWTMSFVATLAKQILLFTSNAESETVDFRARLVGKGIADHEDPPIGSSVPAFAAYMFADAGDGQHRLVVQRGGDGKRISLIEAEVIKSNAQIEQINVGGSAVLVAKGQLILADD